MSTQGTLAAPARSQAVILLEQWGRWSQTGGSITLHANSMFKLGSTIGTAIITDDSAMIIDYLVSQRRLVYPQQARALELYYCARMSDARVGRRMRVSTSTARNARHSGEDWLDGVLDGIALSQSQP